MAQTERGAWFTPDSKGRPEVHVGGPHPTGVTQDLRGFTGKRGDKYYYKGQVWTGPSNRIGARG